MAEDTEMKPVEPVELKAIDSAPPVVNPLKPAAPKPALKMPPKPGATMMLKPGLKLPPKPGATMALKPGLRLPSKPMIRKPGAATALPKPLPKPVVAAPKPEVAEQKPEVAAAPAVAEKPQALESLKSVTQKLKGATQAIPQQAILHKTGIIADSSTVAQKEAAKHKTARISLSDAMGVAPVKDEHAPMKTIQIKRPINLPKSPTSTLTKPAGVTSPAPSAKPDSAATTVTQRKTLKITRPGSVRPTGAKFGVKKPVTAAPAASEGDEVADIPDLPVTTATAVPPMPNVAPVSDVPSWVTSLSAVIQVAACVAIGALVFYFYQDAQLPTFCGGLGWNV